MLFIRTFINEAGRRAFNALSPSLRTHPSAQPSYAKVKRGVVSAAFNIG